MLRSLSGILLNNLRTRWHSETHSPAQLREIAANVDSAIDILQAGTIRTVVSQAAIAEPDSIPATQTHRELPPERLQDYISERLELLQFLHEKIDALKK